MKPKLLIVFPLSHLAYSPTTINLYDALETAFEVTIVAPLPPATMRRLEHRRVIHVRTPPWAALLAERINFRLRRLAKRNFALERWLTAWLLLRRARREASAETIGVDFLGLWVAQRLGRPAHLLSLEIAAEDPFQKHIDLQRLDSVLIQTPARYDHLFRGTGVRPFFVQNAPVYRARPLPASAAIAGEELLYCGTAVADFGIYRYLDFLVRYPSYRLTIQGSVPPEVARVMQRDYAPLFAAGRVTVNQTYLEAADLIDYVSGFAIGLCCYDLTVPGMDRFNFRTAPSGKLFEFIMRPACR